MRFFELGPLLDQQLNELRLLRKKGQESTDGLGNLVQRILVVGDAAFDSFAELAHDAIDRRQEKLLLAGEIAVQGTLADPQPIGQDLGLGVRIAVLGEDRSGPFENFFLALQTPRTQILPGTLFCHIHES
jgi:hypothetical protein